MTKIKSNGKCIFCNKEYSKSGMTRHLTSHLTKKVISDNPGLSYHLKIETSSKWEVTPYFLHLWVNGECTFDELDSFLRGIWLECCGHMSSFRIPKKASSNAGMFDIMGAFDQLEAGNEDKYNQMMQAATGQIPLTDKLVNHAKKGVKIEYEYDSGSSTELDIAVVNVYPISTLHHIVLLSRNEPPHSLCPKCNKSKATEICTTCCWEYEAIFCKKCAKTHEKECDDFSDYARMPIVNSPRAGVCGYTGGSIDVERD